VVSGGGSNGDAAVEYQHDRWCYERRERDTARYLYFTRVIMMA
jgi:hypothetical protein